MKKITRTGEAKDNSRHVTIRDVARLAGVSTKTVSRVLNGEAYVAKSTLARVKRVMQDLDYYPHAGAQNLRAGQRNCIGVTFSATLDRVPISETLLSYLFSHLYRLFGAKGIEVSFDFGPGVPSDSPDYARGLWSRRFGGLVVLGPLAASDPVVARIHASMHPYLTTSRTDSLPECSSAAVDLERAAYMSTKFLLDRGHRRIALLTSFEGYNAGAERRRGHAQALLEAGIEKDESLIRGTPFVSDKVSMLIHRLLMDRKITALIDSSAGQDSKGIREGVRLAGRTIGKDVEVLCWTYTDSAVVMSEACAHVWVPIREALVEGLEWLAEWFNEEREGPINVLYQPTLYETQGMEETLKPKPVFDVSL